MSRTDTTLRLSGPIQSANIGNIRAQINDDRVRIFMDLDEVTLVDVEVVRILSECEDRGIVLVPCPPYVREWGFFASEPKGHSRKFRMVCDSRRGYLRSRKAVLAIKFSPACLGQPPQKVNPSVLDQFSIPHTSPW